MENQKHENSQGIKRSSELLQNVAAQYHEYDIITYGHILELLKHRAFGLAIILFALPSALPFSAIPGVSFVFSLPIAFFAVQLILANSYMWLPERLAARTVSTEKIKRIIDKSMPYFLKLEKLLKPRLGFLTTITAIRIHGIVILVLVFLLMLPIPFSNFVFSVLIILFGLGLAEKDGYFILAAYIGFMIYISVILLLVKSLFILF